MSETDNDKETRNGHNSSLRDEETNVKADEFEEVETGKDERIRQLEEENRVFRGKLKGYETLGHLLHEAKQECGQYKQRNEALRAELQGFSGFHQDSGGRFDGGSFNISPLDGDVPFLSGPTGEQDKQSAIAGHAGSERHPSATGGSLGNTSLLLSYGGGIVSAPVEESLPDQQQADHQPSKSSDDNVTEEKRDQHGNKRDGDQAVLTQVQAAGTDDLTPQSVHNSQQSRPERVNVETDRNSDSFSFVSERKREEKEHAPSLSISTLHSGDSHGAGSEPEILDWKMQQTQVQQSTNPNRTNADQDQMRLDSSPESEEWTRHLRALGSIVERRFQQSSPLTVDITNLLHRAIKQDKQTHGIQVLLAGMSEENQKLTRNAKQAEEQLADAREQISVLMEKQSSTTTDRTAARAPSEWVHVEKQNNAQNASDQVVMMTEVDLQQRKFKQYEARMQELQQANRKLEEFCKHQRRDHENQLARLRRELGEVEKRADRLQREVESLRLLSVRAEEKELEKMRLTEQLQTLRRQSKQLQQHYDNEKQESHRLQNTVDSLRQQIAGHQEINSALQSENRSIRNQAAAVQVSVPPDSMCMPSTMADMKNEVVLLRQQIAIYKDDFDNERRDREKGQTEKNKLEEQMHKVQLDFTSSQKEIERKQKEINSLKTELEVTRRQLQKRTEELRLLRVQHHQQQQQQQQQLQRQQQQIQEQMQQLGRENVWPPSTTNYHYGGTTTSQHSLPSVAPVDWTIPPQPTGPISTAAVKQSWSCRKCTFENIPERVTCEMCGERATNVRFGGTNMPTMVEQYQPEPIGCQQHLIARSPYGGRIECDTNRATVSSRRLTSNDPNDLVTDSTHDEPS